MKKLLLAAAFAAISLGGAAHSPAYAMNYKYRLVEDHAVPKVVVDASGEIMPNEVALFAAWGASPAARRAQASGRRLPVQLAWWQCCCGDHARREHQEDARASRHCGRGRRGLRLFLRHPLGAWNP